MTIKGHFTLAALPVVIYYQDKIFQPENLSFLILVLLGATLPDIDEPKSYIGRKLPFISLILKDLFRIEHRTITHSVFIPAILTLISFSFGGLWWLNALAIGVLLHIVGDMLTKGGVPLLYPIYQKNIRLLPKSLTFYTASPIEYLLIFLMWGIIAYLLFSKQIGLL